MDLIYRLCVSHRRPFAVSIALLLAPLIFAAYEGASTDVALKVAGLTAAALAISALLARPSPGWSDPNLRASSWAAVGLQPEIDRGSTRRLKIKNDSISDSRPIRLDAVAVHKLRQSNGHCRALSTAHRLVRRSPSAWRRGLHTVGPRCGLSRAKSVSSTRSSARIC